MGKIEPTNDPKTAKVKKKRRTTSCNTPPAILGSQTLVGAHAACGVAAPSLMISTPPTLSQSLSGLATSISALRQAITYPHRNDPVAEDTAHILLWVGFPAPDWVSLTQRLDQAKLNAGLHLKDVIHLGGDVYRHQTRKYVQEFHVEHYQWSLSDWDAGISIHLVNDSTGDRSYPNMQVRCYGRAFLRQPCFAALWAEVQRRVTAMGGTILSNKLKRVDVACDLVGEPLVDLYELYDNDAYVGAARAWEDFSVASSAGVGSKTSGFRIGAEGAALSLRVYDKLLYLRSKGRVAEINDWCTKRWGFQPSNVTRVEFQMRSILKGWKDKGVADRGVYSVEDWLLKRPAIVAYLTIKWIRFIVAGGNRFLAPTHPLWCRVQAAFDAWGKALQACYQSPAGPASSLSPHPQASKDRRANQLTCFKDLLFSMARSDGVPTGNAVLMGEFVKRTIAALGWSLANLTVEEDPEDAELTRRPYDLFLHREERLYEDLTPEGFMELDRMMKRLSA